MGSRKQKNNKKGLVAQAEGQSSRETIQVSQVYKARVTKRPNEEGRIRSNAITMVATTSCEIVRSGKKHFRSFDPQENKCPALFAHTDKRPGWNLWSSRG